MTLKYFHLKCWFKRMKRKSSKIFAKTRWNLSICQQLLKLSSKSTFNFLGNAITNLTNLFFRNLTAHTIYVNSNFITSMFSENIFLYGWITWHIWNIWALMKCHPISKNTSLHQNSTRSERGMIESHNKICTNFTYKICQ